ncbi:MAG: hypothetical protein FWD71_18235 [Oscillospiraceae bacterium]|nr:hypothetical protein [Oscillospiraceae bacterium]
MWLTYILYLPIMLISLIITLWGNFNQDNGWAILFIVFPAIVIEVFIFIFPILMKSVPKIEELSSYPKTLSKLIVFAKIMVGVIIVVFSSYYILMNASVSFNQIIDKKPFSDMIDLKRGDIDSITVTELYIDGEYQKINPKAVDVTSYADKSLAGKLIYDGPYMKKFRFPPDLKSDYSIVIYRNSNPHNMWDNILFFSTDESDRFLTYYEYRSFYVISPQLEEIIKKINE